MESDDDVTYANGFTAGYQIQSLNPGLMDEMTKSLDIEFEYDKGIMEGSQEYIRYQEKARLFELESIRGAGRDHVPVMER